ncbi:hypothetical protein ACIBI9_24370 [Nonomuraea sp. NPDC050451]|uniref:hypothetical protein n=1 Tax=Nonomuraea sp. NPDC050451 TaxID=3364364 RepID=UPI0037BC3AFD
MMNQHESIPDLMQEDTFEVVMRGYNRRQVHDYMIRTRNQVRDLEERLARAIDQAEQGRIELAEARRRMVEAPQSYDDLSPRLAQILRLGEEEAAAKREDAVAEAASVRDAAKSEADRLLTSSRETADKILTSAQAEAERRVNEATQAAERMLAQAGSDAEEQLAAARTEAEDLLRDSRAESERLVTAAQSESEQIMQAANAQAEQLVTGARNDSESMLTSAQQRTAALDEQTGRRVEYLTNTHTEVVRRLTEISSVLGDLMRTESAAGPLVPDAVAAPVSPQEDVRVIVDEEVVMEYTPVVVGSYSTHPQNQLAGVALGPPPPPPGGAGGGGAPPRLGPPHSRAGGESRGAARLGKGCAARRCRRSTERKPPPPIGSEASASVAPPVGGPVPGPPRRWTRHRAALVRRPWGAPRPASWRCGAGPRVLPTGPPLLVPEPAAQAVRVVRVDGHRTSGIALRRAERMVSRGPPAARVAPPDGPLGILPGDLGKMPIKGHRCSPFPAPGEGSISFDDAVLL